MEDRYFFIAYASSGVRIFSTSELTDLLAVCRARNSAAGVTGMLAHSGGNFLQALEGPEEAVRATMDRISRDPRHRSMIVLHEGFRQERLFGEWAMAFEQVPLLDASAHPGMSRFLSGGQLAHALADDDEDIYAFFRTFRDHLQ